MIVAELIGSSSGIGHMIIDSQALLATGQIIFGIIVIGIIGLDLGFPVQGGQSLALSLEPDMSKLRIENVSRVFPAVHGGAPTRALEPTDLDIADNDFVTILGPSGCGKSTLLRLVAGLDTPTTGQMLLDGKPVTRPGPDRGMVFQSYTLFPWLTISENVGFRIAREGRAAGGAQRAWSGNGWSASACRAFARHYPKQLSGGMQQRTAIARALANGPAILLLDEPFGALDNQTRALMQELLLGIWERERKTVLFVTHDIEEAIFLASRVLVMTRAAGPHQGRSADDAALSAPLHDQDLAGVFRAEGAADGGDPRRGRAGGGSALKYAIEAAYPPSSGPFRRFRK